MEPWITSDIRGRLSISVIKPVDCASCTRRQVEDGPRTAGFEDIAERYRSHGGLLDGDELAGTLRHRVSQPISSIARLIVSRRIVSLNWRARTLVPLFQFERGCLSLRSRFTNVFEELVDVLDNDELVRWFATESTWLDGAIPVAMIATAPDAVREAARADRFVLRG